ncbi:hypothetical protein SAMN06298216_0516 [Spirosomataceae bacterium TFI 002]|nr:hypothetical protein SAMN06298216_0516 [Spirosomataceae bacterium TFI 002]
MYNFDCISMVKTQSTHLLELSIFEKYLTKSVSAKFDIYEE